MDFEGPWIRKSMTAGAAEKEAAKLEITKGKNVGKKEEQPSNWQTGAFIKKINPMEGIEGRTEDKGEKWIIGKPRAPDTEVVPTTK